MAEKKEKGLSFEQSMERLEEIVRLLERGEAPLEASLTLYSEGSALLARCAAQLDEAEQLVNKLAVGEDGAPLLAPFAAEGGE